MTWPIHYLEAFRRDIIRELGECQSAPSTAELCKRVNFLLDEWDKVDRQIAKHRAEQEQAIAHYEHILQQRREAEERQRQELELIRLNKRRDAERRKQTLADKARQAAERKAQQEHHKSTAHKEHVDLSPKSRTKRWKDWKPLPEDVPIEWPVELVEELPDEQPMSVLNSQIDRVARAAVIWNYHSLGHKVRGRSSRRYEGFSRL